MQKSYSETKAESSRSCGVFKQILLTLAGGIFLSACGATHLNTKVSGNLSNLSASNTVAILPAVAEGEQPKAMADLFRQSLHAHLKQSNFNLLEPYIVDSQLENSGLTDPSRFWELDPMRFGEALGVDAVLITRINKMEKSYLLLHSSIEMSFSARMVDTRSGEILWMAEQTETDFEGIGKIPTGLAAAVIAPIYHVTNAMEIDRMTSQMVDKLTSLVRFPDRANREGTFQEPMIANAWNRQESEDTQVHWSQVLNKENRETVAAAKAKGPDPRLTAIEPVSPHAVQQEATPVSKAAPAPAGNKISKSDASVGEIRF